MLVLIVLALASLLWVARPAANAVKVLPRHIVDVSNGERMFHAGGCVSCHSSTDDQVGLPSLGGGLKMETDFGTFSVPNISPHTSNGIGRWTTLDFVNAMQWGASPDG